MVAFGASHQRIENLTGRPFGHLVVTGRAESLRDGTACWIVRCPQGHLSVVRGSVLRANEKRGGETRCATCDPSWNQVQREIKPFTPRRTQKSCGTCGGSGHMSPTCPERKRAARQLCETCCNLSHRRRKPKCPECRQPHIPEKPLGIIDAVDRMRAPSREVVF